MPYLVRLYDAAGRIVGSAYATTPTTTIDLTFFGTGVTADIHYLRVDLSTVAFEVNKIEFLDGSWTEYTSDTYWYDSLTLTTGVWDTDHWDAQEDGTPSGIGNPRILLYDVASVGSGFWVRPGDGYRPTKMRITMTGDGLEEETTETPIVATPGESFGGGRRKGRKHSPLATSRRWK